MMILLFLTACNVAVTGTGDVNNGGTENARDRDGRGGGACALWDIVGKYEDGVEITRDCRIKVGTRDTLVIDDPETNDPDFFNRQLVWGNWAEDQEIDQCWVQLVDDELFVDCWEWDYRGFKEFN